MNRFLFALLILSGATSQVWAGEKGAGETGKLKALYFAEAGCPYCDRFEKETLTNRNVKDEIKKISWQKLDPFSDEPTTYKNFQVSAKALAYRYKAKFFPAVVIVDSEWKEIVHIKGFWGVSDFLHMVKYASEGFHRNETFSAYIDRTEPKKSLLP